jgi:hypothetical protein
MHPRNGLRGDHSASAIRHCSDSVLPTKAGLPVAALLLLLLFLFQNKVKPLDAVTIHRASSWARSRTVYGDVVSIIATRFGNEIAKLVVIPKPGIDTNRDLGVSEKSSIMGQYPEKRRNHSEGSRGSNADEGNVNRGISLGVRDDAPVGNANSVKRNRPSYFPGNNMAFVSNEQGHLPVLSFEQPKSWFNADNRTLRTSQLLVKYSGLLSNLRSLLLNLTVGVVHRAPLKSSISGVGSYYGQRGYFKNYLSYWRLVGATSCSFFLMIWGWLNVRRECRVFLGLLSTVCGCALWVYSLMGWTGWWVGGK